MPETPALYELYLPREDSSLLQQAVKKYARGLVLDMGTGSGIQAEEAAKKTAVSRVIAVDKNPNAIAYCKRHIQNKKITFLVSDLFSAVQQRRFKQRFDTILFNPPYLPSDPSFPDMALDGGKQGYELIECFLEHAPAFLKQDGCLLLLFSTLTNQEKVHDALSRYGFQYSIAAQQRFSFETIFVYKITKQPLLVALERRGVHHVQWFSKGKRGLIYTGFWKGKQIAIKIHRPNSAVDTIQHEAMMLRLLNKYSIGPRLLGSGIAGHDQFYLFYQFVHGSFIIDFLKTASASQIISVLRAVFLQMRRLDKLTINKEEMHHPYKHILIGPVPGRYGRLSITLLDFERCRKTLTPQNVTQFCQCIISTRMQVLASKKGVAISKKAMINAARAYKKSPSHDSFQRILHLLQ